LGLLVGAGVTRFGAPSDHFEIRLTALDGRVLVQEAFADLTDSPVTLSLSPGGRAFQIANPRIIVNAVARSTLLDCPIRISGVPALAANRFTLRDADVSTEGMICGSALAALQTRILTAIAEHPWDLAERLTRASVDPAVPGPRLPMTGCVRSDRIRFLGFRAAGNEFLISVEVAPAPAGLRCP
jgi:hypothetical protein